MDDAERQEGVGEQGIGAAGRTQTEQALAEHNMQAQQSAQSNQMIASGVSMGLTIALACIELC
jgi:hypothetical protein